MKAKLTWTDPTQRADGSTLLPAEIAEVAIWQFIGVGGGNTLAVKVGSVEGGVGHFKTNELFPASSQDYFINFRDIEGNISPNSNVVTVTVPFSGSSPKGSNTLASTLIP